MRIERLSLENLASLRGHWTIDFTDPAYQDAGIFVIAGPTGSGKSTLLDGICLALYGQTPRSDGLKGTAAQIISKQATSGFAEVVFRLNDERYSARWSCKPVKKRDGTRETKEEMVLNKLVGTTLDGTVEETQISKVKSRIEELTGMNFKQFTQSMLLAQGSFAKFLQAETKERSELLMRITDTTVYSALSQQVFIEHKTLAEQHKQLHDTMTTLSAGLPADSTLLPESIKSSDRALLKLSKTTAQAAERHQHLNRLLTLINEEAPLKRHLLGVEEQLADHQTEADRQKQLEGLSAAGAFTQWSKALNAQEQADEQQNKLLSLQAQLKNKTAELALAGQTLTDRQAEQTAFETQASEQEPLLQARVQHENALTQEQKRLAELKGQEGTLTHQQTKAKEAAALEHKAEYALRLQMAQLPKAEEVRDKIFSLEAQKKAILDTLNKEKSASIEKEKETLKKHQEIADNLSTLLDEQQKMQDTEADESAKRTELEETIDKRTATLADKKAILELNHRLQFYSADRLELVFGQPCPLCGATDHPFADEPLNPEQTNLVALKHLIHNLTTELQELNGELKSSQTLGALRSESLKRLQTQRAALLSEQQGLEAVLLGEFGVAEGYGEALATVVALQAAQQAALQGLTQLDGKLTECRKTETNRETWQSKRDAHAKMAAHHEAQEAELIAQLNTLAEKQQAQQAVVADLKAQIAAILPGIAEAAQALNYLKRQSETHRAVVDGAKTAQNHAQLALNTVTTQCEELKKSLVKLNADYAEALAGTQKAFVSCGLTTQAEFAALFALKESLPALQKRSTELTTNLKLAAQSLNHNHAQKKTEQTALHTLLKDELVGAFDEALLDEFAGQWEAAKNQEADEIRRNQQLKDQLIALEQVKTQLSALAEQVAQSETELKLWDQMNALIGSADGKKFNLFAQSFTFDRIIAAANGYLQGTEAFDGLNDRYVLQRDEKMEQPTIVVIDTYQAGEMRAISTLSGGETFVVSLALALGLTQSSGARVQVESLFLDEGFGTLDEETLQVVLEALMQLQTSGKMIGIISHVQALKDRIPTRIQLHRINEGHSRIEGPAVSYKTQAQLI